MTPIGVHDQTTLRAAKFRVISIFQEEFMFQHRCLYLTLIFLATSLSVTGQASNIVRLARPAEPGANKAFHDCPECPEMVVIPAGTFQMGSPASESGRYEEEGPQRVVKVRSFAAVRYDVTRGQWTAFVRATQRFTDKGCDYSLLPEETEANASWMNLGFAQ
jgi:formylglycine-generating enzyme required for sulfatase activity